MRTMDEHVELVAIWWPIQAQEVPLIHSVLGSSGIRYHILNEHYAQGVPGIGDGAREVRVEAGRAEEALRMIEGILGTKRRSR